MQNRRFPLLVRRGNRLLPIFYSAIGFLFTLLMSALYNVAAGLVGGIEIEIDAAGPQEPHSANL